MLKKANRIDKTLFKTLGRPWKILRGNFLMARIYESLGQSKFSITVSKKIEKSALKRNAIRRSVYRQLGAKMPQNLTIQFVLSKKPDTLKELEKDLNDINDRILQNNNIHPSL